MHENDGRCGICGDPWDAEQPRPNEAGGLYARGVIGRTYSTDKRFIDTVIQVTSSMSGFFEFNICPNDNIKQRVKQECLDQFPLRILSKDRSTSYGRRYHPDIKAGLAGIVELSLEIPEGLECKQCVLQWRWHGGKNLNAIYSTSHLFLHRCLIPYWYTHQICLASQSVSTILQPYLRLNLAFILELFFF